MCVVPTPFYNACLRTLSDIGDSELSSKKIYLKLLSSSSSSPILSRHWAPFVGRRFSLDDQWSLVRDSFTKNHKNDLLWLIVLYAVKVRDSLQNWGYINSAICASCTRRETIDHCFLNCSRVKRVWQRFVPCLSSLLGVQFVCNVPFVFFFRWPVVNSKLARIAHYLVKSILYGVWFFRNKATFYNGHEDSKAIIRFILDDIRRRIRLDHFRLPDNRFSDFWAADNFCSVQNGLLHFDI